LTIICGLFVDYSFNMLVVIGQNSYNKFMT